jgi:hypothetical protein
MRVVLDLCTDDERALKRLRRDHGVRDGGAARSQAAPSL